MPRLNWRRQIRSAVLVRSPGLARCRRQVHPDRVGLSTSTRSVHELVRLGRRHFVNSRVREAMNVDEQRRVDATAAAREQL